MLHGVLVSSTRLQLLLCSLPDCSTESRLAVGTFSTYSAFPPWPPQNLVAYAPSFVQDLTADCPPSFLAKTIRPSYRTELHNSSPDEEGWLPEHIPPERYR
jgi:hypothetical protein